MAQEYFFGDTAEILRKKEVHVKEATVRLKILRSLKLSASVLPQPVLHKFKVHSNAKRVATQFLSIRFKGNYTIFGKHTAFAMPLVDAAGNRQNVAAYVVMHMQAAREQNAQHAKRLLRRAHRAFVATAHEGYFSATLPRFYKLLANDVAPEVQGDLCFDEHVGAAIQAAPPAHQAYWNLGVLGDTFLLAYVDVTSGRSQLSFLVENALESDGKCLDIF